MILMYRNSTESLTVVKERDQRPDSVKRCDKTDVKKVQQCTSVQLFILQLVVHKAQHELLIEG